MQLSPIPEFGTPRRMFVLALVVTVAVAVMMWFYNRVVFGLSLGDTDDAMRLVLVRELVHGKGWWDQLELRLQPPMGVYMHWSRLIDGALAALRSLFELVGMSPGRAEVAIRVLWPNLWIVPTVTSAFVIARRFGGGAAVFACALIAVTDLALYVQYRPGRVDHHSIQISMCLISLAFAIHADKRRRWALMAGAATGVGLCIGLEALAFEALIGAGIALRFAFEPRQAKRAMAYALGLGATTVLAFLIQTPPWRWGVVACDAIAFNLVATIVTASAGLALAVRLTRGRSLPVRLGGLVALGAVSLGVYLGLDPNCRHGIFADVDPRIVPIWLKNVQEVRTWFKLAKVDAEDAITLAMPCLLGVAAWAWLGREPAGRKDFAWLLAGACLFAGLVAGMAAVRMASYAEWFAVPLIAAAADFARRYAKNLMIPAAVIALVASPIAVTGAGIGVHKVLFPPKPKPKGIPDHCFEIRPYALLRDAAPVGLVLSEVDLGPLILAHTPHSALAGPYHRMSWGIMAARGAMALPADKGAEAETRKLGATYVLECRAHGNHTDREGLTKDSLMKRLDNDKPPAWLERLSDPKAVLQVYRVRPPGSGPVS